MHRRHLATALLALGTLALAGCGSQSAGEAGSATSAPPSAPAATTPEPTSEPTPEPVVLDEQTCGSLYTALREVKAVEPDPELLTTAVDAVPADLPEELAGEIARIDATVRKFATEAVESARFLVPAPEVEVSAELATACAPADVQLDDIPLEVATVEQTCSLLTSFGYDADPLGHDLEEIVTFFLDRAVAHAPDEIEAHVAAYYDRMLPLGATEDDSRADRELRIELAGICDEYGDFLIQPDGAGF